MEIQKRKYDILIILIIVMASLAFFGGYLHNTYQTDTYSYVFYPYRDGYLKMIKDQGRYAQWLYFTPWFLFGKNPSTMPGVQVAVALAVNGAIMFTLWKVLYRQLHMDTYSAEYNFLLLFLVISMRLTVFETDIIQFGYFSTVTFLGDYFALISAIIISLVKKKSAVIIAGILLIISITFMQPSVFWFVPFSVILMFCDYIKNKDGFVLAKEILKRIMVYAAACVWQLLIFGILIRPQGGRGDLSKINIVSSLHRIADTLQWLLKDCMGVMPPYLYTIFCIIGMMAIVAVFCTRIDKKGRILDIVIIVLSLLGTVAAVFVPCFIDEWITHRTISGYMLLLPLICFYSFILLPKCRENVGRYVYITLLAVVMLNLSVNWFSSTELYKEQVIVNAIDQADTKFYYSLIKKYEFETGIEVTKIARGFDTNPTQVLSGTTSPKSINDRAMDTSWGFRDIFPFVTGHRFDVAEFDSAVYDQYFAGKDWDVLSEEQVVCIGDTAYIVYY